MHSHYHRQDAISYYYLNYAGELIWCRQKPIFFSTNYVRESWMINHSDATSLVRALVDSIHLGASPSSIDNVIALNKEILAYAIPNYGRKENIVFTQYKNGSYMARSSMLKDGNIIHCGFGKTAIHAAASLLLGEIMGV